MWFEYRLFQMMPNFELSYSDDQYPKIMKLPFQLAFTLSYPVSFFILLTKV